jgi:importin subunit beta-1
MKDPNNEVKLVACKALNNALTFARANMEREVERDFIMTVICECCQNPDNRVRAAALECLVKVADEYYEFVDKYMQALFNVSVRYRMTSRLPSHFTPIVLFVSLS